MYVSTNCQPNDGFNLNTSYLHLQLEASYLLYVAAEELGKRERSSLG